MKGPRRQDTPNIKTTLAEKNMLSLYSSGVYLSTKDIVDLGKALDIELPYKVRRVILQQLFIEAKAKDKFTELVSLISKMMDTKAKKLSEFSSAYPASAPIVNSLIQKANSTKMLLQRELRLNPYA